MEFTTWPQVNMINQKNYYTCVNPSRLPHLRSCFNPPLHPCHLSVSNNAHSTRAMVARKVLDGLRKGKKDVYALNIQYVKRYQLLLCCRTIHLLSHHFSSFLSRLPYTQRILTATFNQ